MDKRIILLIVLAITFSTSFLIYRKFYFKHEGIRYSINPKLMIKTSDSISFEDQTSGATRWKWDFGDGEFSAARAGSHTYLAPGHYRVRVSSYGSFGAVADSSRIVDVMPGSDYVSTTPAEATGGAISGSGEVQTGTPTNYESTTSAGSYEWTVEGDVTLSGRTQKNKVATYSFTKPGRKTLVLTTHNPEAVVRKDINVRESVGKVAGENPLPPPPVVPAGAYAGPPVAKKVVQHDPPAPKVPQQHQQQQPQQQKEKPKSKLKELGEGVEY